MSTDANPSGTAQAPLSEYVAAEIRADLGRQGISQRHLAAKLGVSAPWVSDRLSGKTTISLDDLVVLATALRRPVSFFLPPTVGEVGPETDARSQPMRSRPSHARRGTLTTHEYLTVAKRPGKKTVRGSTGPGGRTPRDTRPKGRGEQSPPPPTLRRPVRTRSTGATR